MNLRDQMLKAGLISEEQAKRAGHQKRVKAKQAGHKEAEQAQRKTDQEAARRAREERQAKDRDLNLRVKVEADGKARSLNEKQRAKDALEKALREGVLPSWEGNRTYHFADGGLIRTIRVTEEAARRLEAGKAAIARLPGRENAYTVLHAGAATALNEADPTRIAVFHR